MECVLVDREQILTAVSHGTVCFDSVCRGFISVFSHTDSCTGVTLRGLKYPLENACLTNRFPLGVSNEFTGVPASVTVDEGVAVLVYGRTSAKH